MTLSARTSKRAKAVLASLALILACGLIGYGTQGFWRQHQATHEVYPTIIGDVITQSTDEPSETKPTDACEEYKAADTAPERISIPEIGASGCVTRVGIDQHGAIAVPDNIYTAAWYIKSALPGQPGLSIIDGHISGRYKTDAIFQHLNQLKDGDTFTVTLGNGTVLAYEVYREQFVPVEDAITALLAKDASVQSQLNLITCGGEYDKDTKLYDHRVIVSAKLVSS